MEPSNLPTSVLIALVVIAVADLALLVIALVRLARTPSTRRSLPWPVWLLIIVVVHPIGAICFLALGRTPAPVTDTVTTGSTPGMKAPLAGQTGVPTTVPRTAAQAMDELYRPEQK